MAVFSIHLFLFHSVYPMEALVDDCLCASILIPGDGIDDG